MQDKGYEIGNVLPDSLMNSDVEINDPMPGLPMSLPGMNIDASKNQTSLYYSPKGFMPSEGIPNTFTTGIPYVSTLKDRPEKPGWFEQIGHDLLKYNTSVQAGKYVYNSLTQNPSVDLVEEGWKVTPDDLENFPDQYFPFLYQSRSPADLASRQQKVREQIANDERFQDGTLTQNLISGIGGFATDPISYFMPFAVGMKYSKIAQNVFLNMGRTSGGIALDSVTRNMLIQANREGGNLQDAVTDSMADYLFGSALVGAGATAAGGLRNAQLWNMRKSVKHTAKGVNINPVVKEKNGDHIITGYRASMAPGYAEDKEALAATNLYIDESMKMGGAFALPYVGEGLNKFLSWGPLASPVLKAANSPYKEVQRFFNGITSHGIITEGESKGIARQDSASDFAEQYADEAKSLSQYIREQFFQANGIEGGVTVKNSIKNLKQVYDGGRNISEENFGKEVRRIAYEEGYQSETRQAHAVASQVLKFYEKMGIDYHTALGEGTEFLDPRTAWKYLPQNYHIPAMINDEQGFVELTANELLKQDELISELKRSVDTTQFHIDLLKQHLENIDPKNYAGFKRIQNELKKAEENKVRLQQEQILRIQENPDYHILLEKRLAEDTETPVTPVFRALFKSHGDRMEYAKQVYDSILNQSPMDLLQNVLGRQSPGIIESPSYLKKRTVMINSQIYNQAGFLDPDIAKSVTAYAGTMGKIIGFKKAFPEFATSKNYEGLIESFKISHDIRKQAVQDKEPSKERTKELNVLQKQFTEAQKFMKDTYNVYMGTYASKNPELSRWSKSLKNLTVSAKLGAVPIYQITELASIALKQGLMPFMAQGLRPMLKSLNGHLSGKESEAFIANAANAHIGIYGVRNGYAESLVNADRMSHPPYTTASESFGVATDNIAHMSGNIFGINQIANMNERIMANTFQSEVMQAAFGHRNGKLSLKQRQKMSRYGIQIEEDGPKFIKGYEESGGWEIAGGYQSQYFNWDDTEASNRMALSMRRAVKDTVLNANVFSSPYWAQNPIPGMIFMFHGWAYNALNHYTIPLMQRPDAEALLGVVGVVGMSLMSEPLLRIANGKEAFDDDETWFQEAFKAIDYSGLIGPYANQFQVLNAGLGNPIPGFQTERAKNFGSGLVGSGGPVAGYINDLAHSVGHLLKKDFTENDANRFERLAPFSSAIPIRKAAKQFISSFNLPQTRKGAESESWLNIISGD